MMNKVGRNDPCPCGSGRKHKQCCAKSTATRPDPASESHAGAIDRALDWLTSKHRKALATASKSLFFARLTPEQRAALDGQDTQLWDVITFNSFECLVAEGSIVIHGERRRVAEYLLEPGGPLITAQQRHWVAQLAQRPLRLYEVIEAVSSAQITLRDSLASAAPPIVVHRTPEREPPTIGMQLGARIVEVAGRHELSGALYVFMPQPGEALLPLLREAVDAFDGPPEDLPGFVSEIIRHEWLVQLAAPKPYAQFMDNYSHEPLLLVSDDYRVKDWPALTQLLAAQDDLNGNRASGWTRRIEGADGQRHPVLTITRGKRSDRIELLYKTHSEAEQGYQWFEALAGETVKLVLRSALDPKELLYRDPPPAAEPAAENAVAVPEAPPAQRARSSKERHELIEVMVRRMYANWPNLPIPALAAQTPRQAIATLAGQEQVKQLLRSYEISENLAAQQSGRNPTSFAFLWQALGIAR